MTWLAERAEFGNQVASERTHIQCRRKICIYPHIDTYIHAYLHKIFHSLPELMSESKRWDTYIIYTHTYMYMHSYIHLYVEIRYLCIFVATFPLPLFRFTISAYFSFRYCVSLLTCCWVKQTLAPHKLTVLLAPLISIAVARTKIHIYAHTQRYMRVRSYTSVCQAKKF